MSDDTTTHDWLRVLEQGTLEIEGRLVVASNATFFCTTRLGDHRAACVYKPIRGERPLRDFPHGSLAAREVATYLLSQATGHDLVPPTVLRDGPFGEGMCQLWIEHDTEAELVTVVPAGDVPSGWLHVLDAFDTDGDEVSLVHADDERLRLMAAFDVVMNNADRKAGHVVVDHQGRAFGVDHGLCLHHEHKLRTVLWGWHGQPLGEAARTMLDGLRCALTGPLAATLADLLEPVEIEAISGRLADLRSNGVYPRPGEGWPAIPWPVF